MAALPIARSFDAARRDSPTYVHLLKLPGAHIRYFSHLTDCMLSYQGGPIFGTMYGRMVISYGYGFGHGHATATVTATWYGSEICI